MRIVDVPDGEDSGFGAKLLDRWRPQLSKKTTPAFPFVTSGIAVAWTAVG